MYFCKSKRHVWTELEDAKKCCNGHKRVVVFGNDVPADAKNIRRDERTGSAGTGSSGSVASSGCTSSASDASACGASALRASHEGG